MKKVKKIVVFRLSAIGDIVLTTALLRNLRQAYPDAQIDFIVKRQFSAILSCVPYISNVYQFDSSTGINGLIRLRKRLKKQKYDVALDIHKNWRSLFVLRMLGIKTILKYKKHVLKRYLLIKFKIDAYNVPRPVYLRFIDAAAKLGIRYDNKKTELQIPTHIQQITDNYLEDNGIKPQKNIIAICPGASFTNKQWGEQQFTELTQKILQNIHTQVVLLGGYKEKELCESIVAKCTGTIISVAGVFDLTQSAALLNRAQLTIANDTGMLHMSEALNVPVIGIYGPTVRQFGYFPLLDESKVAQVELNCRPCTKMGMNYCPTGTYDCMKLITVDTVYTMTEKLFNSR